MLSGKTSTGFEYMIDEEKLSNDMEFVDALAEADEGNAFGYSKVLKFLFNEEDKKKLYDHVRTKDGKVPLEKIRDEIIEILGDNDETKNS